MAKRKSKLAAIMFTDIVGYSVIMSQDETRALNLLDQHNQIVFPMIEEFDGRIVKTMGDAILADFNSALSAANCAMNIQRALAVFNKDYPGDGAIVLRIGIHIGDVWYDNNGIVGESVNIAAQLEPFSLPGGIAISRDMFQILSNKSGLKFQTLGLRTLKNIEKQIEVYHLATGCEVKNRAQEESQNKSDRMAGNRSDHHASYQNDEYEDWEKNPGEMLKNKVFTAINTVMDTAVNEWNKSPKHKKNEFVNKMKSSNWFDQWEKHEKRRMKIYEQKQLRKMRAKEEMRLEKIKKNNSLGMGIVSTIGFGIALAVTDIPFLAFPLIFMGIIPLISGIKNAFQRKRLRIHKEGEAKLSKKEKEKDIEKQILRMASYKAGKLTVLEVATETDLSIEEAKAALDQMASKGYVEVTVKDNGSLCYEFLDFTDKGHRDPEDYLANEIDKLSRE